MELMEISVKASVEGNPRTKNLKILDASHILPKKKESFKINN